MSNYITGNRDTDEIILLNLEDKDLVSMCQVNNYLKDICANEAFWIKKIIKLVEFSKNKIGYKNIIKYKLGNYDINSGRINLIKFISGINTYKELYIWLKGFNKNIIYYIYVHFPTITTDILKRYVINSNIFPKYINIRLLTQTLIKEYAEILYKKRNVNVPFFIKPYLKNDTPGFYTNKKLFKLPDEEFQLLQTLWN